MTEARGPVGQDDGAPGVQDRGCGQQGVGGQAGEPALRLRAEPLGHHETELATILADADDGTVGAESSESADGDDAGQLVDGVGGREVERDAGERGQAARGGDLRLP